jgi:formate-dependent nitrite reductase membrane component NrfD
MVETLSVIASVAMGIGAAALVLLHLLPTGYNPIRDAVSDYAIGRYRAVFWVFTTAGAVSGFALALALARSNPSKPTLTIAMLLLSGCARLLIPLFPTDQDGNRFQTLKGTIHMVLAVVIFAAIAVAASNLGGTLGREPAWHAVNGLVDGWLPWVITGSAIATGLAIRGPRIRRMFGLIERLYYLSSITWFLVVSIELARIGG